MGTYKKSVLHLVNKVATFLLGEPVDDEHSVRVVEQDMPPFGIPAWKPGKSVRYHSLILNTEVGTRRNDFATLAIVFRENKHSYDEPRFFQIDRYGIRPLIPYRLRKRMTREKKNAKGEVIDVEEVINNEWAIGWKFDKENFIHFDCPQCGLHVEDCTCIECPLCFEVGIKQEGDRPWRCEECKVEYDLHGYWKDDKYTKVSSDYEPRNFSEQDRRREENE
ncbi:MAG: hypothetical protein JRJ78_15595, partial [Deltaproteobacteria bacterium]|nr:hypothetical protein [Deltaproteobacteria bacterium]